MPRTAASFSRTGATGPILAARWCEGPAAAQKDHAIVEIHPEMNRATERDLSVAPFPLIGSSPRFHLDKAQSEPLLAERAAIPPNSHTVWQPQARFMTFQGFEEDPSRAFLQRVNGLWILGINQSGP
jgi:hypothetical protein